MWRNWHKKRFTTIMKQVRVSAKRDYLETLATTKQPLTGVAELIWNGLDADALNVSVSLVQNGIHGIESIVVEDNGNGIPNNEAELAFGNLGGSWKTHKKELRFSNEACTENQARADFAHSRLETASNGKLATKTMEVLQNTQLLERINPTGRNGCCMMTHSNGLLFGLSRGI
jgi:hypothetical protein